MQPIKIKSMEELNDTLKREVELLSDDEIIVIFSDKTFTKVSKSFEGLLKNSITGEAISLNPINTNWKPIWVGLRLFNAELREIQRTFFKEVTYISYYIENDIIKNNNVNL